MNQVLKNGSYTRAFAGDDQNARDNVTFWLEPVLQPGESDAAGRPIYKDVEMWELRFPGNPLLIPTGRVSDYERQRWPAQYEAFKKSLGGLGGIAGTPLEQWTGLSRSQIAELRAINILTVEMLAAVDDHGIQRMGANGRKLVERAKVWLEAAEDNAITDKLASKIVDYEDRVKVQDSQIADLTQLLGTLTAKLQALESAGIAGIGPAHLRDIAGSSYPAPTVKSALEADDGYVAPRRGPGRPKKTEQAADAA